MRIGLIALNAMGNVNREILGSGFDYAAFVERNRAISSLPSLALLTLAGCDVAGRGSQSAAKYEYFEAEDIWAAGALPQGLDLVAISSYSGGIYKAYDLARQFRARGVPTVIGGPHASLLPDEAAEHCDAVAIGEGESIWPQIVEDAASGRLRKMYGSLEAEFDLKNAPMPAYHLLDPAKYNRLTVETSRGCPHRCEFCASSVLISGKYKQKPAEKVLAEIDYIRERWPRPFIELADDNTFVNRRYWCEILPEIKKRNIRWFAEADISLAKDEELLALMHDSGCWEVLVGLESPLVADLDGLELHNNWKRRQSIKPEEAIHAIQSHGIMVNGCFVLGLDSHGPDIFDAIFDFVAATDLFDIQITLLTPFPGTPLYKRLKDEGRLLEDKAWGKCSLFDINFQPKKMSLDELVHGYANLASRIYNDEFTKQRRRAIRQRLRENRQRMPFPIVNR